MYFAAWEDVSGLSVSALGGSFHIAPQRWTPSVSGDRLVQATYRKIRAKSMGAHKRMSAAPSFHLRPRQTRAHMRLEAPGADNTIRPYGCGELDRADFAPHRLELATLTPSTVPVALTDHTYDCIRKGGARLPDDNFDRAACRPVVELCAPRSTWTQGRLDRPPKACARSQPSLSCVNLPPAFEDVT